MKKLVTLMGGGATAFIYRNKHKNINFLEKNKKLIRVVNIIFFLGNSHFCGLNLKVSDKLK